MSRVLSNAQTARTLILGKLARIGEQVMCGSVYSYILAICHYAPNTFSALSNFKREPHICPLSENRQISKICQHSRVFSHKLTSNRKNWLSHTVFTNILANMRLFGKFGSAGMYLAHIDEYDPHITCSPILAQYSRPFSENKRMCGSGLRNGQILTNTVCESQSSQLLISLCENTWECWWIFGIRLFSAFLQKLM